MQKVEKNPGPVRKIQPVQKIKPIKIKKKDKSCPNCRHYNQYFCSLRPGEEIPHAVLAKGCPLYKKNKHIYF